MQKDIQLFDITGKQKQSVVGTQIFDPTMPSNLDFDQVPLPIQKPSTFTKPINIGQQLQTYTVVGKLSHPIEPMYRKGSTVKGIVGTFVCKVFDQQNQGIKGLWDYIVCYTKRQLHIKNGFIYYLQKKNNDFLVHSLIQIGKLFKVFVDPQQQKIRFVIRDGERIINRDISPQDYIGFINNLSYQLNQIGLSLKHK